MYVTNITDDYDKITSSNYTNITDSNNCTVNENNNAIIIPTLLLTIPGGITFLCLKSLMVYTLIKPLFSNK